MSEDDSLRNRSTIVIITGGTQGLGLAIAKRLTRQADPVQRNPDGLDGYAK
jgi:NAD(P)-dependent dehydrogenase (short-subunit alcohol dehydrogenase family)